jgi:hypothetical protein
MWPAMALPAPAGDRAALGFVEFFTAHIRNPNTRATYGRRDARLLSPVSQCAIWPSSATRMTCAAPHLPELDLRIEYERRADPLRPGDGRHHIAIAITGIARTNIWPSALCDIDLRKRRL